MREASINILYQTYEAILFIVCRLMGPKNVQKLPCILYIDKYNININTPLVDDDATPVWIRVKDVTPCASCDRDAEVGQSMVAASLISMTKRQRYLTWWKIFAS